MKRLLISLLVFTLGQAFAQSALPATPATASPYVGGVITRTYQASDLKNRYGILDIGLGEIWVMTLPDDVTDVVTSKEGVLQFSQKGNHVIIGALASSGNYPILVTTTNDMYFFMARLNPNRGGGIRNIVVQSAEQPLADEAISGFPTQAAQPVSDTGTPKSKTPVVTPAAPLNLSRSTTTNTSPATTFNALAVSLTPKTSASTPTTPQAVGLPATATTPMVSTPNVNYKALTDGTRTMLYYQLNNPSQAPVIFNPYNLQLLGPGGKLSFQANPQAVTVFPNATQYGQVTILGNPASLQAYWVPVVNGQAGNAITQTVTVDKLKN